MTLLAIQVVTTLITLGFSYQRFRFGFLFTFLAIMNVLLIAPFFMIYFDLLGQFDVRSIVSARVEDKVTLEFNTSALPIIYMLLGQWAIFIGYLLPTLVQKKIDRPIAETVFEMNADQQTLARQIMILLMVICFSYLIIRFTIRPDFPILAYVLNGGGNLRDIAYEYGIEKGFYPFRPSIVRQFTRIGVPLTALYSYVLWKNGRCSGVVVLLLAALTVALAIGTFKRTPIVYLVLWAFLFVAILNPRFRIAGIIKFACIAFAAAAFMTFLYTRDVVDAWNGIVTRVLIGEARGQYLAFLHYGTTIEFENFNLVLDYARKVLGQDVMAFSERWKIVTGGTRGFTSIGAVAETYVSFGYAGLGLLVGFGLVLSQFDRMAMRYMTPVTRPIIAGLIGIIAFSSTKGLLSQMFTGGALFLFGMLALVVIWESRKAATTT